MNVWHYVVEAAVSFTASFVVSAVASYFLTSMVLRRRRSRR